ncbi:MAG: CoA pyrophosphatase [Rhodocyclaceae bacterium]|nr:CoA pyrophosphatase [Zoogloeaceae bacterium]MBP9653320.1 CoA pyrophosphatase [Rhodocyclaceae bacterium]OQY75136.1 MAG: CoA pyrophosphatase [Rhodocyclaceae bacterium UTPRO2]MCC7270813.1 CoA pyrophosphatase [Rhodocyclaceae bacterium]MCL4724308.1 CoA pyrophosphatase [Rhodocyclaceae bacterium]
MHPDAGAPTADWLRRRLAGPRQLKAVEEDAVPPGLTPAAVLVPVIERSEGLTVLFTQRTAHLHDHAGQVSFPGGRCEVTDVSPTFTALRETTEEIGLASELVEVLGLLPEYRTGTGFSVTPVVGLVRPPFELNPDSFEVAEVFETPLAFLLDPANHQRHSMEIGGVMRHYYAMPYEGYFIWGATAGMLVSLYRLLYGE